MGSDSQELSFVRCPSCRSLVPAVSTRCRMCGAGLGGDAAKSGDEEKKESRVRQRTMSTPRKEIDSAVTAFKNPEETPEADDDDPLGAYLEEIEDSSAPAEATAPTASEKTPAAFDDESGEEDDFDDFDDDDWDFDDLEDEEEEEKVEAKVETPAPVNPTPVSNGKKSMSFAKPPAQPEKQEEEEEEIEKPTPVKAKGKSVKAPAVESKKDSADALAGWLVSFDRAQGVATELRSGKFFVTGSSLKPKDLVLNDQSVSTPHALVTVSLNAGITIQDLMSDNGVFVQRRGEQSFQRIAEVVAVSHGDRVRFGKVEFLVSCLPDVSGA